MSIDMPLNEQAVREEIIAPLLKALNYRAGGENDIRYELKLHYPRESLGRKKPDKDPPQRGDADYVCYAGGRVAWTIEAKPSGSSISLDDVEQAFSYARHPQVRAVYFCLRNGNEFRIYVTDGGPDVPAIATFDPRDTSSALHTLKQFVGAEALLGRFAKAAASAFPPIGPGLDSFAKILQGSITHERTTPDNPLLRGFTVTITGGAIQRLDDSLIGYFESKAPYSAIQRLLEKLGLMRVETTAKARELSTDPATPTVFATDMTAVFPKGESLWDIPRGQEVILPEDLYCRIAFSAQASLAGIVLRGPFSLQITYQVMRDQLLITAYELSSRGEFEFLLK